MNDGGSDLDRRPNCVCWIDPSGDDTALGIQSEPLATLEEALRRAAVTDGPYEIVLGDGVHRVGETLDLPVRDGPTVIRAAEGARPVVDGGVRVGGWEERLDGRWVAPTHGHRTRSLWLDGVRAPRARGLIEGLSRSESGFRAPAEILAGLSSPASLEFVFENEWNQYRIGVERVDGEDIVMREPAWANAHYLGPPLVPGLPTWIENAAELLDEPGSWSQDVTGAEIVLQPGTPRPTDAVLPSVTTLLRIRGTSDHPISDVSIRGVAFRHAGWDMSMGGVDGFAPLQANHAAAKRLAPYEHYERTTIEPYLTYTPQDEGLFDLAWMPAAVEVDHAANVTFQGCTFERLGGAGLNLASACECSVRDCTFTDIAGTAIQVGRVTQHHPEAGHQTARNVISDCLVSWCGLEYPAAVGIFLGFVADTVVEHNHLHDLPYSGISLGWGWGLVDDPRNPTCCARNLVRGNLIERVMTRLRDGGGIYSLGAQPGTVIEENVVAGMAAPYGGIYLDEGSRHVHVRENVCVDTGGNGYWVHYARDCVLERNWWDPGPGDRCPRSVDLVLRDNTQVAHLSDAPSQILAAAGRRSATDGSSAGL